MGARGTRKPRTRTPQPGGWKRLMGSKQGTMGKKIGEEQIDGSVVGWCRPFPSRTWGPRLPEYTGPAWSPVRVYDGEGKLLRVISMKELDREVEKGPRVKGPVPYDWRLPKQTEGKGWRKYGYRPSGATPI